MSTPNPSDVVRSGNRQKAIDCVKAVEASKALLEDLYADPLAPARERRIGAAHNEIRMGLAVAKVHATLAIADAIAVAGHKQLVTQVITTDQQTDDLVRREYLGGRS